MAMTQRIFLSHAAADRPIAERLASEMRGRDQTVSVFVASRPGDIRADQEWPSAVQAELRNASAYIVLLTPNSTDRPWVWFETGAAWMSEKQFLPVLACGMRPGQVPSPINLRQLLNLEVPSEVAAIFAALGINHEKTESFCHEVRNLGLAEREVALFQQGWRGVTVGGAYYAWGGPLSDLEDRNPIPEQPGLIDALRSQGMQEVWAHPDNLAGHLRAGVQQVFQTDRKTFRRPIKWGDVFLAVRPTSAG